MKKLKLLLLFVPLLPLFATQVSAAKVKLPDGTLKRNEIRTLFANRTVNTITAVKGQLAVTYYAADGEVRQSLRGKLWRGNWRVTGKGRLCLQMEGLSEKCRIVVREGESYKKYIVKKNGQHVHTLTYLSFTEGNPYGL